ncbi:MAG TPA: GntR family transcriptional regulator [Anaerolineales bacterium]|nr:GntR family transcriptional regulator [Anaerolineales bacterium]
MPKQSPTPTPKPRASDQVENELRRLILTLELEPGLAVSEASLMKRYGWGRTPLREAFQRLSEQGLLQMIPQHGAVVTPLSLFDFVEVMDAMNLVIGPAAVLACKRLNEAELAQLDALVAQAEAAAADGDFERISELDYQFHATLAQATGNRYLSDYLLRLHQVARRFNFAAWKRARSATISLDEHRRLAAVFRSGEAENARAAMLQHIEGARQRVIGSIQVDV